jgi:hypothetical protein
VQCGRLWPAVGYSDTDENIVRPRLGVFGQRVEVPSIVKDPRVGQLEFRLMLASVAVLFYKPGIREFSLRILV